eukprot:gene12917-8774_t
MYLFGGGKYITLLHFLKNNLGIFLSIYLVVIFRKSNDFLNFFQSQTITNRKYTKINIETFRATFNFSNEAFVSLSFLAIFLTPIHITIILQFAFRKSCKARLRKLGNIFMMSQDRNNNRKKAMQQNNNYNNNHIKYTKNFGGNNTTDFYILYCSILQKAAGSRHSVSVAAPTRTPDPRNVVVALEGRKAYNAASRRAIPDAALGRLLLEGRLHGALFGAPRPLAVALASFLNRRPSAPTITSILAAFVLDAWGSSSVSNPMLCAQAVLCVSGAFLVAFYSSFAYFLVIAFFYDIKFAIETKQSLSILSSYERHSLFVILILFLLLVIYFS